MTQLSLTWPKRCQWHLRWTKSENVTKRSLSFHMNLLKCLLLGYPFPMLPFCGCVWFFWLVGCVHVLTSSDLYWDDLQAKGTLGFGDKTNQHGWTWRHAPAFPMLPMESLSERGKSKPLSPSATTAHPLENWEGQTLVEKPSVAHLWGTAQGSSDCYLNCRTVVFSSDARKAIQKTH